MNEETKAAPSQSAWADGFKSLLHKHTGLPLDSSLFQVWLQACPWGNSAEVLELAVWAVTLPHTWVFIFLVHSVQATRDTGELSLSVFSQIPAVILSVLAERASASLWRSALHMSLCSEVLFLCLHHSLLQIKSRGDRTLVKCSGERGWTRMRIPPFKKCR